MLTARNHPRDYRMPRSAGAETYYLSGPHLRALSRRAVPSADAENRKRPTGNVEADRARYRMTLALELDSKR